MEVEFAEGEGEGGRGRRHLLQCWLIWSDLYSDSEVDAEGARERPKWIKSAGCVGVLAPWDEVTLVSSQRAMGIRQRSSR